MFKKIISILKNNNFIKRLDKFQLIYIRDTISKTHAGNVNGQLIQLKHRSKTQLKYKTPY